MKVRLIWATPDANNLIAYMARVSNPENQDNTATAEKLIAYLIKHSHWSPFEMADLCLEIETERDVSRQLLRHGKAFRYQEFSQRYADTTVLPTSSVREARMQDTMSGTARATVTSVSGVVGEVVSVAVYAGFALGTVWLPLAAVLAAWAVPLLGLAAAAVRWLPPSQSSLRSPD